MTQLSLHVIDFEGIKKTHYFRKGEYRNLMELIVNKTAEDIGDCKGRAWCGTCHVECDQFNFSADINIDEKKTLNGLEHKKKNSRLACQIMLDESINEITFTLKGDFERS